MRILDRLVAAEFVRIFVSCVLGAPLLFIIGDATEHLEDYLERGLDFGEIALAYAYQLPLFFLWSFPIAALIASVFTIHGMTVHREIVAAKAGGISFHRLIVPLVVLGIVLTAAALALGELVPVTNRLRAELMGERSRTSDRRSDFVYQAEDGHVLAIRQLHVEEGRLYGLVMEREGHEPEVPTVHVMAEEASYDGAAGWTFERGYVRVFLAPERETTFFFDRLWPRNLTETPEDLLAEPKDPEEMSYGELGRLVEFIRRSGGDPSEILVERAQKIAIPVATLVIILFGAPLATSSKRGGRAYGIGVSLSATILYLLLFRIAGAAGESGTIPPLLAAWLPNGAFLVTGIVLLARVRT
ncbi:MAG: LptF/LptG family permease [Gemmatimonadetes bacterium]|nr:LptF/LptG family permease [Gemmatimonadota bacterium]